VTGVRARITVEWRIRHHRSSVWRVVHDRWWAGQLAHSDCRADFGMNVQDAVDTPRFHRQCRPIN
jgi:hypothetical protein